MKAKVFNQVSQPFFHLVMLVLLLGGTLSSCQQMNGENDPVAQVVQAMEELDCTNGDEVEFPIECGLTGLPQPDYFAYLNTGPYSTDDCMCLLQGFTLTFDNVAPNESISIVDEKGEPVSFTVVVNSQGQTVIEINDLGQLEGDNLGIFIDFFLAPEEAPMPDLVSAGGLCIIDNISGMGNPVQVMAHALFQYEGVDINGDSTWKIFGPAAMGQIVRP